MKRYLCILLAACLFVLCGCGKGPSGTEVFSNSQFSILESGGEYFLDFKVEIPDSQDLSGTSIPSNPFSFSSLSQMKTFIEVGAFSPAQLAQLQKFTKASNGSVAVCNVNALWDAALPEGLSVDIVYWYGLPYALKVSGGGLDGSVNFTSKELNDVYREFNTVEENKYIEFLSVTEEPERNAEVIVYYSSSSESATKMVTYSYTDTGGRSVSIIEEYYNYDESKTVPDCVIGIVEGGGVYCNWIFGGFTERPSLEWIKSVSVKPYVETETA